MMVFSQENIEELTVSHELVFNQRPTILYQSVTSGARSESIQTE